MHRKYTLVCHLMGDFLLLVYFVLYIYWANKGWGWSYEWHNLFNYINSSYWNIFDFMVLLAAFADFILDILDLSTGFRKSSSTASKVILVSRLIRIVRVVRLIRLCKGFYSKLLKWYDSKINTQMAFAYDIGKVSIYLFYKLQAKLFILLYIVNT